jgi:hypothetical protein
MQGIDNHTAREIAKSDLVPGFTVLMNEKPTRYKFDEKAFKTLKDQEVLGLVEEYHALVQKGLGWKASVTKLYDIAQASSLNGFR